jgi:hypothetical protein
VSDSLVSFLREEGEPYPEPMAAFLETNAPEEARTLTARDDNPGWLVITSYTQQVVAKYETQHEAEDVLSRHTAERPDLGTLEVCRAS